jgi:hypothetical protein
MHLVQSDFTAALISYQNMAAIFDGLAKSNPDNTEWQHDLAQSYAKMDYVYRQSGDEAKAAEMLAAARVIIAQLAAKFPDEPQWAKELAFIDAGGYQKIE